MGRLHPGLNIHGRSGDACKLERKRVNGLVSTCTLQGRMDERMYLYVHTPD